MIARASSPCNREHGFTLPEVLIATGLSGLALALAATALMGFAYSARTTALQLETRHRNQDALKKLGRQVMESTKVEVEEQPQGGSPLLYIWHDDQVVWTPETTDDDTRGVLYLDADTQELRYRPDYNNPDVYEVFSRSIESVHFEIVGHALFAKLSMHYDSGDPDSLREMLASFAVRNNPKNRLGASN